MNACVRLSLILQTCDRHVPVVHSSDPVVHSSSPVVHSSRPNKDTRRVGGLEWTTGPLEWTTGTLEWTTGILEWITGRISHAHKMGKAGLGPYSTVTWFCNYSHKILVIHNVQGCPRFTRIAARVTWHADGTPIAPTHKRKRSSTHPQNKMATCYYV